MGQIEIVEKLNNFISKHASISEECQALYLMVELRKLLDHEGDHKKNGSFTLLRFYCDWTMHTDKEHITNSMRLVMDEIYQDLEQQIIEPALRNSRSPITRFLYMEGLRLEMKKLFEKYKINSDIIEDGWVSFVQYLVKVLENQPIKNPNSNISLFTFLSASEKCVYGTIEFNQPIDGKSHYDFGNVY